MTPWAWLRSKIAPVARRFSTVGWAELPYWHQLTLQGGGTVTREYALGVSSVLTARNDVCGVVSGLPLEVLDEDNGVVPSLFLDQIDPDIPNMVTLSQTVEDLLFSGISWWRVLRRDLAGFPQYARRYDPSVVTAQPPDGYVWDRLPSGFVPGSFLWVGGEPVAFTDLIRFDSPHPAILQHGGPVIRRARNLQEAGELFAQEPGARGWFEPKDGADIDTDDIDKTLRDWNARRKAGITGYVPGKYLYKESTGGLSATEVQLIDQIRQAAVDVANLFGLDSEDLNVSTTSRTYANAIDRRLDKRTAAYGPMAGAIQARLSMDDVTPPNRRVAFNWSQYLTPNPVDQASIAAQLIPVGVLVPSEIRADMGRPQLTAAQRAELPSSASASAPGTDMGQSAPGAPAGPEDGSNVIPFPSPAASFSSTAPVGFAFDMTDIDAPLSVDVGRRTITGLVVPWNQIGFSQGRRWRFLPGSLRYSKAHLNQIKFFSDHDPVTSVGFAARTWSDDVGQWATFKIARGPAGDRALLEAADGAKDGLSVGIGFAGDDSDISAMLDPNDSQTIVVIAAPWRETSQVALPAFAGARITAVAMAADPIGALHMTQTQAAPAAATPAPGAAPAAPAAQTFGGTPVPLTDVLRALQGAQAPAQAPAQAATAVAQGFSMDQVISLLQLAQGAQAQAAPAAAPAIVNPLSHPVPGQAPTGARVVAEPPLYRFDGNPGKRSFIADLKSRFGGDETLRGQAEEFIAQAMAIAFSGLRPNAATLARFANIAAGDVNELNPVLNRPDLYIPRLQFTRPMGSRTVGGAVDSITQSTLPKFNTATGLAATHSAGTEPTEGTFTTTSVTVTPAAMSGLLKVNREVIDQGGSPQVDQVMWDVMTQFYAELLENRVEAFFDGLSLTPQACVGVNGLLSASVQAKFLALQYIRGGDRYTALALHQAFYAALAGALDFDDRPLFPMDNPSNAAGTVAGDLSFLRVHGKQAMPAWALETANGGPATPVSYLWVPTSVYQWFSPPRRIDLGNIAVSRVEIGIWGYSAEFATRDTDVIELTYAEA